MTNLEFITYFALSAFGLAYSGAEDETHAMELLADKFDTIIGKQLPENIIDNTLLVNKFIEAYEDIKFKLERLESLED